MRTMRLPLVGAAVLALVVGAVAGVAGQAEDAAAPTLACVQPIEPGDYVDTYEGDSGSADYWVVVPGGYAEDAPVPLVMWLSWISDVELDHTDWKPHLADLGVLFVVVGETRAWDVEALLALISRLEEDYCVDPEHIHVMGASSSGYAVGELACVGSERIASFFGGMGRFAKPGCTPERPVPLIAITGDRDRSAARLSLRKWTAWNGCSADPLVEDLGSGVSRHTYQDCDADIVLFDIEGASHGFIFNECIGPAPCEAYSEVDQFDEALAFFEQHPLPD